MDVLAGHAFISYVREDGGRVDRLQAALEDAGVRVWRDTARLWPGQDWRAEIHRAITADSLAFIACFSDSSGRRETTYQYEELVLAVEQMRLRSPDRPWLIPVRFARCGLPDLDLGSGRTMSSLQHIDLFDGSWDRGIPRLLRVVLDILHEVPAVLPGTSGRSALGTALLTDFLEAAAAADVGVSPLLQRLARRQLKDVTWFLRQLPAGGEIGYDGEDREWLLGLTEEAQHSIDAVSMATPDAAERGVDGGLWTSDLGARYLERQRAAIDRNVTIRRIFVTWDELLARDESFLKTVQVHRDAGVDVRILGYRLIPEWLRPMITDSVVFDGAVSYEMTLATIFNAWNSGPIVARTVLSPVAARIRVLEKHFGQLWLAAGTKQSSG